GGRAVSPYEQHQLTDAGKGVSTDGALRHLPDLPDRAREEPRRGPPRRRAGSPGRLRDFIAVSWHHPAGPKCAQASAWPPYPACHAQPDESASVAKPPMTPGVTLWLALPR